MRPVTHGDIVVVACAIRNLPPADRRREILRLADRAHAADLFRKRTGRAHPFWGNGSLAGAVARPLPPEPFMTDTRHLEALAAVIDTLLGWRHRAA